jgi:26S proteasome regulatory subunit N3
MQDIKENVKLVERGLQTKESRHIIRVMRTLFSTRKRLNDFVLKRVLNFFYVPQSVQADKEFLFKYIDVNVASTHTSSTSPAAVALMETDDTIVVIKTEPTSTPTVQAKSKGSSVVLPEVDLYLHLLVLLYSIDKKKYKSVIGFLHFSCSARTQISPFLFFSLFLSLLYMIVIP